MMTLFLLYALAGADSLTTRILDVIGRHDITYFGEEHELRDARQILGDVLRAGFASGTIDAFATEYVDERVEPAFQAYLTDVSAEPGSSAEGAFFARIESFGFLWLRDGANLEFLRLLREAKRARPELRICGMDYQSKAETRAAVVAAWPAELRRQVDARSLLGADLLLQNGRRKFEREPEMAMRAWSCVRGAHHAVVHVGNEHAWSLDYEPAPGERSFLPPFVSSQYMRALAPRARIATLTTALPFGDRERGMSRTWAKVAAAYGRLERRLFSRWELPARVRRELKLETKTGGSLPFGRVWDYFLLGPAGTYAPIFE